VRDNFAVAFRGRDRGLAWGRKDGCKKVCGHTLGGNAVSGSGPEDLEGRSINAILRKRDERGLMVIKMFDSKL